MKRAFVLSLMALTIVLAAKITVSQQDNDRSVVSLQGGFAAFKLEVIPLDSNSERQKSGILRTPFIPNVIKGNGNVLHRLIADEQGRFVFVYDLVITVSESPKRFGVSARALDTAFEASLRANNPAAFKMRLSRDCQHSSKQQNNKRSTMAGRLRLTFSLMNDSA